MTSLDSLPLDDFQELSENDHQLISLVRPPTQAPAGWAWSPAVIAILVTITAIILNSSYSVLYKEQKGVLMPSREGVTTIQLTPTTRDKLKDLGKKGESYEGIILRLIKNQRKR